MHNCSGSNLFDTLTVILKEFSKKVDLKKNGQMTKNTKKIPGGRVKSTQHFLNGQGTAVCSKVVFLLLVHYLLFLPLCILLQHF